MHLEQKEFNKEIKQRRLVKNSLSKTKREHVDNTHKKMMFLS